MEYSSAQDFEQLLRWVDGGDEPDVVRTFSFRSDALQEISSLRNVIYKIVLCLLARSRRRWSTSGARPAEPSSTS